jgi:hypothetical protein
MHWKPKPKAKWVAVEKQPKTRIPVPPAAAQGRQKLPPSLWFQYFPTPGADESFCKCAQAQIAAATLQPVIEPLPTNNTAFLAARTQYSPSAYYGTDLIASMQMIDAVFPPRTQQQTIGRVSG